MNGKDLPKGIETLDASLVVLLDDLAELGKAANGGAVLLGEDRRKFAEAIDALGIGAAKPGATLTSETIAGWARQITAVRNNLDLLKGLPTDKLLDQLAGTAAGDQVEKIWATLERVGQISQETDARALQGKARAYYAATSMGAAFSNLQISANEIAGLRLRNGMDRLWSGTQMSLRDARWQTRRVDRFAAQLMDRLPGVNLDNSSTPLGKMFQDWKADVNRRLDPADIDRKIQAYGKTLVTPMRLDEQRRIVLDQIDRQIFSEEMPKLKAAFKQHSPLAASAGERTLRSRRLQGGRLAGGLLGLSSVANELAIASTQAEDPAMNYLTAAAFFASAMQIPNAMAVNVATNWQNSVATPSGKSWNDLTNMDRLENFLKKQLGDAFETKIVNTKVGMAVDMLRGRQSVHALPSANNVTLTTGAPDKAFLMRRGSDLGKGLGGSVGFFAADLMSFAVDIYGVQTAPPQTALAAARVALNMGVNTGFLAGDLVGAFAKGAAATLVSRASFGVSTVLMLSKNVIDITESVEALKKEPDSVRKQFAVAGAVLTPVVNLVVLSAAMVNPVAALAVMLIPDVASIGRALELKDVVNDLAKRGQAREAALMKELYKVAAMDSAPIVNWFSAFYTSAAKETALDSLTSRDWLINATRERLNAFAGDNKAELTKIAGEFRKLVGAQTYHMVFTDSQTFRYSNLTATTASLAALTVRDDGGYSLNTSTVPLMRKLTARELHEAKGRHEIDSLCEMSEFPGLAKEAAQLNRGFNQQIQPMSGTSFALASEPVPEALVDTVFQIRSSSASSVKDRGPLVLDNSASQMRAMYLVEDSGIQLRGGKADDIFMVTADPVGIDGGGGVNVVNYRGAKSGRSIDLGQAKNIAAWYGSKFVDVVKGTSGDDRYVSNGGADVIELHDGNDIALVSGDAGITRMGPGDDVTYVTGYGKPPASAGGKSILPTYQNSRFHGDQGSDVVSFEQGDAVDYRTTGQSQGEFGAEGLLEGYESLIGSGHADSLQVLAEDSLRQLSLGGGDDALELGATSGVWAFGGDGNDTIRSTGETNVREWTDGVFSGGAGNDFIDLRLNKTSVSVAGGEGDDMVIVNGIVGQNNWANIVGGAGDDTIELQGDLEAQIGVGSADRGKTGADTIYDSAQRTRDLTLLIDGFNRPDVKVSLAASARPGPLGHTLATTLSFGESSVTLNTHGMPGRIFVVTTGDKAVSSLQATDTGSGAITLNLSASSTSSAAAQKLIQDMAGFAGGGGGGTLANQQSRLPRPVALAPSPLAA